MRTEVGRHSSLLSAQAYGHIGLHFDGRPSQSVILRSDGHGLVVVTTERKASHRMTWAQFDRFKTVKVKQESRHALVVLARPSKSNALDDTMWTEIPQVRRHYPLNDTRSNFQQAV